MSTISLPCRWSRMPVFPSIKCYMKVRMHFNIRPITYEFMYLSIATLEDFDHLVGVNYKGTFLCYKYAAIQMMAQGRGGRIIGKEHSVVCPLLNGDH